MLITIVIIGVLVALMAPVVGKATDNARRSQCLSNLRQVFTGVSAYAAEHNGTVPSTRGVVEPGQNYAAPLYNDSTYGALLLLYPNYISEKKLFVCPSDAESNRKRWEADNRNGLYTSYFAYRDLDTEGQIRRFTATDPNFAGRLPLMGDAAKSNFHKTGYNVCFMDGHVEYVPESLYQVPPYVNFFWE